MFYMALVRKKRADTRLKTQQIQVFYEPSCLKLILDTTPSNLRLCVLYLLVTVFVGVCVLMHYSPAVLQSKPIYLFAP